MGWGFCFSRELLLDLEGDGIGVDVVDAGRIAEYLRNLHTQVMLKSGCKIGLKSAALIRIEVNRSWQTIPARTANTRNAS